MGAALGAGVSLREFQDLYVQEALKRTHYNKARAARMLGISERTLYRRLARQRDPDETGEEVVLPTDSRP